MDNTTVINPNKQTPDTGTTQRTRIHEIERKKNGDNYFQAQN